LINVALTGPQSERFTDLHNPRRVAAVLIEALTPAQPGKDTDLASAAGSATAGHANSSVTKLGTANRNTALRRMIDNGADAA
jgi:hypothetical protein